MKAVTYFLLISMILSFGVCAEQGPLYKVIFSKGSVSFERDGNTRLLLKGDLLFEKDLIKTGGDGLVVLSFGVSFSSRMKLAKDSELIIQGKKEELAQGKKVNMTSLFLKTGNIVVEWINKNKKTERMQVRTTSASMGIRGTQFFVHAGKSSAVAAVREGLVVAKHNTRGLSVPLIAGEGVVIGSTGAEAKEKYPKWYKQINWGLNPTEKDAGHLKHGKSLDEALLDAIAGFNKVGFSTNKMLNVGKYKFDDKEKTLKSSCENKVAKACNQLGLLLIKKNGAKAGDISRKFLKKGCDLKDQEACVWWARTEYEFGDKSVSKSVIGEMCDQNSSYACYTMWELLKRERDPKADGFIKKTVALSKNINDFDKSFNEFKSACEIGDGVACSNFAILLENINKKDKSYEFYKKACELDDAIGCSNLGYLKQENNLLDEASRLYQKACFMSESIGCYNLACIYSKKNNIKLSAEYLRMAITGGFADWKQIQNDKDLVNFRASLEYKELVNEYQKK